MGTIEIFPPESVDITCDDCKNLYWFSNNIVKVIADTTGREFDIPTPPLTAVRIHIKKTSHHPTCSQYMKWVKKLTGECSCQTDVWSGEEVRELCYLMGWNFYGSRDIIMISRHHISCPHFETWKTRYLYYKELLVGVDIKPQASDTSFTETKEDSKRSVMVEALDKLIGISGLNARFSPCHQERTSRNWLDLIRDELAEVRDHLDTDGSFLGDKVDNEIGDLLWNVICFCRHLVDEYPNTIENAVREIQTKLMRRKPNIFEGHSLPSSNDEQKIWNREKGAEKKERFSYILPDIDFGRKIIGPDESTRVFPVIIRENFPTNCLVIGDAEFLDLYLNGFLTKEACLKEIHLHYNVEGLTTLPNTMSEEHQERWLALFN